MSRVAVVLGAAADRQRVRLAGAAAAVRVGAVLGRVLADAVQNVHVLQPLQQLMHVPALTSALSIDVRIDN